LRNPTRLRRVCTFLNALTNGVTKVPQGCQAGVCHLWHCLT
jgi:hypothetical protein